MFNFKTENKICKGERVRFESKGTLVKINLRGEIGIDVIYTKFTLRGLGNSFTFVGSNNLLSHILKFKKVNDVLL
jgi:hypothetical protein